MPFLIVEREEVLVAGLAVRSPKRALGKARDRSLDKTWSTLLAQNVDRPLASAYIDHAPEIRSYYTQIVGYECSAIDQVARGHVVSRLPAGTYAKFSTVGTFPDLFDALWGEIAEAEESKRIVRSFTGDFEYYPHAFGIDLYVAIVPAAAGWVLQ
ncbi:GyrI-like domain-containing protein [Rhodococcus marinonascens]|uniref:GyrI-like domain-containing protein n=1 Tax=Rhodococcus marinonascens TaxID=38311 RepID=UPI000934287F|nr:GyrI-like domain-containing protein [Rhodococcus marinonascens]